MRQSADVLPLCYPWSQENRKTMSNLSNSRQIDQYFVALWQRCLDERLQEVQDGLWIAYEAKPSFPTSRHDMNYRRKFRSQTSDLCTDAATVARTVREEKQSVERRSEKRKSQRKESKKKEDQRARKSPEPRCFSNVSWLRGSKSRLAKAAGAEPSCRMMVKKLRGNGTKHIAKSNY